MRPACKRGSEDILYLQGYGVLTATMVQEAEVARRRSRPAAMDFTAAERHGGAPGDGEQRAG
jgi:hypothetical protein